MVWHKHKKSQDKVTWTQTGEDVNIGTITSFQHEAKPLADASVEWLKSFEEVILRENDAISDYIHHKGLGNFPYALSDIPFDEPLFSIIPSKQGAKPAANDNDDGIPSADLISLFDQHVIRYHLLLMQLKNVLDRVHKNAGDVPHWLRSVRDAYLEKDTKEPSGKSYTINYSLNYLVESCAQLHGNSDLLALAYEKTFLERANFQTALAAEMKKVESELSKKQQQLQAEDIATERELEEQLEELSVEMPTLQVPQQGKTNRQPHWKEVSLIKLRTMGMAVKISAKHGPVHYANALVQLQSLMIVGHNAIDNLFRDQQVLFTPYDEFANGVYFVGLLGHGEMPDREVWVVPESAYPDLDPDLKPVMLEDRSARKAYHVGHTHSVGTATSVAPRPTVSKTTLALGAIAVFA